MLMMEKCLRLFSGTRKLQAATHHIIKNLPTATQVPSFTHNPNGHVQWVKSSWTRKTVLLQDPATYQITASFKELGTSVELIKKLSDVSLKSFHAFGLIDDW